MDGLFNSPRVLVVHCVDTEGPIGGDVRRKPDGSKEFMDNWKEIKSSLDDITNDEFRDANKDTFGKAFWEPKHKEGQVRTGGVPPMGDSGTRVH